ncbi:hypothetical protein ABKN59_002253 [Abortiporus biennis]
MNNGFILDTLSPSSGQYAMLLLGGPLVLLALSLVIPANDDSTLRNQLQPEERNRTALPKSGQNPRLSYQTHAIVSPFSMGFNRARKYVPPLPQELVDEIIDYLEHDFTSLKACSLVSRVWRSRSQHYLLRTFTIRKKGKDLYKLRKYPNVSRRIQKLVIEGNLFAEVSNSVLVELGLVETLRIELPLSFDPRTYSRRPMERSYSIRRRQLPNFERLKHLSLCNCHFFNPTEMVKTLLQFRMLETLEIDFNDARYALPDYKIHQDSLTSMLPLVNAPNSDIPPVSLNIWELKMQVSRPGVGTGTMSQFLLHSAGNNLKHLMLDVGFSPRDAILKEMDLSKNRHLVSLTLHWRHVDNSSPLSRRRSNDTWLMNTILSRIHSTFFTTLRFQMELSPRRPLREYSFRILRPLDCPKFDDIPENLRDVASRLKSVRLKFAGRDFHSSIGARPGTELHILRHMVRDQLPGLCSRGILEVVANEDGIII